MTVKKRVTKLLSPRKSRRAAAEEGAPLTFCVTGGAGFLGRHIVEQCLKDFEQAHVKVLDIRVPPKSDQIPGVEYCACDLRDATDVARAISGATVVIHTATAAPTGANAYNKQLMTSVNVDGTRNVKEACLAHGVKALVYTSSASVVFEGKDLYLVDESTPYAAKPMDFYTETKILGEKIAIEPSVLPACALRPSGIFGEYDTLTVPTIVQKAQSRQDEVPNRGRKEQNGLDLRREHRRRPHPGCQVAAPGRHRGHRALGGRISSLTTIQGLFGR